MCITSALIAHTHPPPAFSAARHGTRGTSHDSCARSRSNIACTDRPTAQPRTRHTHAHFSLVVLRHCSFCSPGLGPERRIEGASRRRSSGASSGKRIFDGCCSRAKG